MELRKNSLNGLKLCRFCLCRDEPLESLYDKNRSQTESVPLRLKILSSISVEVFPSDKMPTLICRRCKYYMNLCYDFKQICQQADESVLEYIQNGTALEPIVWSPAMVKTFRYGSKASAEPTGLKTVVEGGATVEVLSQDQSDSEDADADVYNVKIGDGSPACIKVVTSNEFPTKKESKCVKAVSESSRTCWACDECECTYPLQQLLELHKMQKHRVRSVECDQCDAKFYSKYDLTTHKLRHTNEMPFECVACDRRFKRHTLLKRHEKIMHSDLPQLKCLYCPASFLSERELDAHQLKHRRQGERQYACSVCDKKFFGSYALQKHQVVVHSEMTPELSCEYCPERFPSVAKLARHVRSHAGERPYPCKVCDKSFVKSHHYTRHFRLKHSSLNSGTLDRTEQFRCDQCEDSFGTQDELIYHSAIHATQNLTCPLCKEKFDDVDAVTAHIKSHVDGTEFSCDFCELVFTSQDKLDGHLMTVHEEEVQQELEHDDSTMDIDGDGDEEDDSTINVKDEGDHMVVEIKKPNSFMLADSEGDNKNDNTNSEDSEIEAPYADISLGDPLANVKMELIVSPEKPSKPAATDTIKPPMSKAEKMAEQTAGILRKADEMKRKVSVQPIPESNVLSKKEKVNNKVDSSNSTVGASDKSLRLLEKELQELQRTNPRVEPTKTPAKTVESQRISRRIMHTSTPKLRTEEKKSQVQVKTPVSDKKVVERRGVKENKEPKEVKEVKPKEDKEEVKVNSGANEDREAKDKERDTPKSAVKNGASDKSVTEEGIRRSTRPSKVKDYAKMINAKAESDDDSDDLDDEEYVDNEKPVENRPKPRRPPVKAPPKPVAKNGPVRKRGRPRKEQPQEVPIKIRKEDNEEEEKSETEDNVGTKTQEEQKDDKEQKLERTPEKNTNEDPHQSAASETKPGGVLVSPSGQTLKKVPVKALPPGIKPMPLPITARPMGPGELCEMQIGKKVVKVQKIVMTKAEVEAMAKKGLVEMKDGTMVLKQGIKIAKSDPAGIKSTLIGEDVESQKVKAAPSRCDFGEE